MNLLLTGGTGFLGRIIKMQLASKYKIYNLSRSDSDYCVTLEKNEPSFNQIFDLVIHAAGKAHSIPKKESEEKEFFQVNFDGTLNLLKGLEKSGLPKRFVFISSVAVYGIDEGININEEYPLLAKDPYGLSKIYAEELILKWCQEKNVTCTILRLPLLVGKKPPGNLGAMIRAIKKGYYFNIGKGEARKSMVLCNDIALFIPVVSKVGGVYNLTDGYHPSFFELSQSLSKSNTGHLNLPLYLAKIFGRIGDFLGDSAPINSVKIKKITSDLTFDDSKARKLVNWNPELVLNYLKKADLDERAMS